MPEWIMTVITVGLVGALFLVKLGQGLGATVDDLRFFRRRGGLMLWSLLVVIVLVPLAFWAVVLIVQPPRPVAVGLAILAACPAAPLAMGKVSKTEGVAGYGACLQLSAAGLAVITTPLVLNSLGWALGFRAQVHPLAVAEQVALAQLLPIGLGVAIGVWLPRVKRLAGVLVRVASILLTVSVLLILVRFARFLAGLDIRSYVAMILATLAAISLGHLLAGRGRGMARTLAIESAMRNPGLALLIASLNFSTEKALPVLIPYLVVMSLILLAYMQWQGRRHASPGSSQASEEGERVV